MAPRPLLQSWSSCWHPTIAHYNGTLQPSPSPQTYHTTMAPYYGTQQWHHIHSPKVGRQPPLHPHYNGNVAPCNGTLVPRPISQSGSSPSPRIGSKNPYSYRMLSLSGEKNHRIQSCWITKWLVVSASLQTPLQRGWRPSSTHKFRGFSGLIVDLVTMDVSSYTYVYLNWLHVYLHTYMYICMRTLDCLCDTYFCHFVLYNIIDMHSKSVYLYKLPNGNVYTCISFYLLGN